MTFDEKIEQLRKLARVLEDEAEVSDEETAKFKLDAAAKYRQQADNLEQKVKTLTRAYQEFRRSEGTLRVG